MEKLYYTITEVSQLLDIKPYVIRYWETEFPQIKGSRRQGRNRRYTPKEVEFIKQVKELLHDKKFTIKGAKQWLKEKKAEQKATSNQVTTKPLVESKSSNKDMKIILDKLHHITAIINESLSSIKS
jgi:DNA-binding transcriptional MerR regulator